MKIIVTGGAGFIGGNFIHHMVNKYPEYDIVNLDLLTYAGNLETLKPVEGKPNYKFVKGDIADRKFVFDLFEKEKPDMVVNFAAESHVDRSVVDPESFVRTNVMGTTTLLDACKEYGIKRYHQVSTDEVYGDLPLDRPDLFFTEETPLHTSSPYSSSKAGADLLVLDTVTDFLLSSWTSAGRAKLTVAEIRNGEGESVPAAPHAMMAFSMPCPEGSFTEGTIIRKNKN